MRSLILYEPDPKIERTFAWWGKSKGLKSKDARQEGIQTWQEVTNEGLFVILLPLESKASPQALLAPLSMPTTSNTNRHSFPWCNNLSSVELPWKTQIYTLVFLEMCNTLKLNGVSSDAIRLCLFPFSLRDKARAWLHSLPSRCTTIWDELTRAFLVKFFPLSKIASLRNQITNFLQRDDEKLCEAWEHFKDLWHLCPHHGLQHWMII